MSKKSKIIVFGATGMIGHKMLLRLSQQKNVQLIAVLRGKTSRLTNHKDQKITDFFSRISLVEEFDAQKNEDTVNLLNTHKPDVILNCIGITLRRNEIKDLEYAKKINSDFPHLLANWVQQNDSKLIHFSTDCVFSGQDPQPYTENSPKTAYDNYGKTKAIGEVIGKNCLTLRGSMIGPEIFHKSELLEWAWSQKGKSVCGFKNVLYSGVTTDVMANLLIKILAENINLQGLYQVSSNPISKYDLLCLINKTFQLELQIEPVEEPRSAKILSSKKISDEIGFKCPSWPEMLDDIANNLFNN